MHDRVALELDRANWCGADAGRVVDQEAATGLDRDVRVERAVDREREAGRLTDRATRRRRSCPGRGCRPPGRAALGSVARFWPAPKELETLAKTVVLGPATSVMSVEMLGALEAWKTIGPDMNALTGAPGMALTIE
jgi:hypothetical protein